MGKKLCAVTLTVILLGVIAFGGVGASSLNATVTEDMYGLSDAPLSVQTVMEEMYGSQSALLYSTTSTTSTTSDGTEEENIELSEISGDWLPSDTGAISTPQQADNKAILLDGSYANLELSAYVKVDRNDAKSDAGLFFRASNVGEGENAFTGYYVGLDAYRDKLVFGRVNNDWTNLATVDIVIHADQYYELKVEATGNTFKLYVDGLLKRTVTDTNPILDIGFAGLRASNTAATFISPQCNGIYDLQTVSGTWSTSDTLATYSVSQGTDEKAIISGFSAADVDLTSYVYVTRTDSASDAGLFFRASNIGTGTNAFTGYYVGIDASRDWLLLGRVNNGWTGLRTVNTPIIQQQYYKIRVKAVGNRIQVFLDDVKVIDMVDMNNPILTAGAIGFRAAQTSAQFKNAEFSDLPQMTPEVFQEHTLNTTCGTWSVSDTEPEVYSAAQGSDDKTVLSGVSYANLKFTTYMKIGRDDAASDAGIIFRASNIGTGANALTGYYVGMDASQDKLWLGRLNNNWTGVKTVSLTVNPNEYYKITIEAQGSHIKVYVNDMLKVDVTDSEPILTAGAVGFRANKTAAWYTRVQHEDITYSDNASLSALAVEGYELSPAFDPDIAEYKVQVSKFTRSVKVTATPADEAATVSDTATASTVTGTQTFTKHFALGNNYFNFTVTAEDGTTKTYTVNIKRGRAAYIRHLIDQEFLVKHNLLSFNAAKNMLSPYMENVSSKFTVFGMKVTNSYQLFQSLPDECEVADIDTLCDDEHTPPCSEWYSVWLDTLEKFPYEAFTTDAVWSGNLIYGDYGSKEGIDKNRSFSIDQSIYMLGTDEWDSNAFIRTTIHEMAHQYGAPDHYHEDLADGTCRAKEFCSRPDCYKGDDPAPRPADCIMGEMDPNNNFADMATGDLFCSGCSNDISDCLESEGY